MTCAQAGKQYRDSTLFSTAKQSMLLSMERRQPAPKTRSARPEHCGPCCLVGKAGKQLPTNAASCILPLPFPCLLEY